MSVARVANDAIHRDRFLRSHDDRIGQGVELVFKNIRNAVAVPIFQVWLFATQLAH